MSVTGIEIAQTAIDRARSEMHLDLPIHHGSVTDMPFDARTYDGVFAYGLLYLLDPDARSKLLVDCHQQLRRGGAMIYTAIAKQAPMFGRGTKLVSVPQRGVPGGMRLWGREVATARGCTLPWRQRDAAIAPRNVLSRTSALASAGEIRDTGGVRRSGRVV